MMYGYGYGPGAAAGSLFTMALMGFFGLLVVAGIVLIVVWAVRRGGEPHAPAQTPHQADTAMAVLRERLAKGEITADEYEATRKALGG